MQKSVPGGMRLTSVRHGRRRMCQHDPLGIWQSRSPTILNGKSFVLNPICDRAAQMGSGSRCFVRNSFAIRRSNSGFQSWKSIVPRPDRYSHSLTSCRVVFLMSRFCQARATTGICRHSIRTRSNPESTVLGTRVLRHSMTVQADPVRFFDARGGSIRVSLFHSHHFPVNTHTHTHPVEQGDDTHRRHPLRIASRSENPQVLIRYSALPS